MLLLAVAILLPLLSLEISRYIRTEFRIQIVLKKTAQEDEINRLLTQLKNDRNISKVNYISENEAIQQISKEFNKDFVKIIGYNPLPAIIEILPSPFLIKANQIDSFTQKLKEEIIVQDVIFPVHMIKNIEKNLKGTSLFVMGLACLIGMVSIVLLSNIVMLDMFEKKFIIRTMAMVGASWWFIKRPFIIKGIITGIISSIISAGAFSTLIYFSIKEMPELKRYLSLETLLIPIALSSLIVISLITFTIYTIAGRILKKPQEYIFSG